MDRGPIFIAGANRSGTTLMSSLLASHPNIAVSEVEPKMWNYYYRQYGDLSKRNNFERCLAAMLTYEGVRSLNPDPDRIRDEFWQGDSTYPRLFALIQQHYVEQLGKLRWGDKSPKIERYADDIFAAYPTAKWIHLIRDPRDRYASSTHWGALRNRPLRRLGRVGGGTARWLQSVSLAEHNRDKYPGRYKIVRYETLVSQPEETLRDLCAFLEEPYDPAMLQMKETRTFWGKGGNSSFVKHQGISTASIGRFRKVMTNREVRFMQNQAKKAMTAHGYELEPVRLSLTDHLLLYFVEWPFNRSRMLLLPALEVWRVNLPGTWKYVSTLLSKV